MPTIILEGLNVSGNIKSEDDLHVHGTLKGELSSLGNVVVEAGGSVTANITAESLSVSGQVTGNVVVRDRIELRAGGRLHGDVKAARLTIADGAAFTGNVDMEN